MHHKQNTHVNDRVNLFRFAPSVQDTGKAEHLWCLVLIVILSKLLKSLIGIFIKRHFQTLISNSFSVGY